MYNGRESGTLTGVGRGCASTDGSRRSETFDVAAGSRASSHALSASLATRMLCEHEMMPGNHCCQAWGSGSERKGVSERIVDRGQLIFALLARYRHRSNPCESTSSGFSC